MTQRTIDGDYIYFVTTLVKDRAWFFVQPEHADRLGQVIRNACALKKFDLFAYCILPNHVHLLVRKKAATSDQAQRALEKARCGRRERRIRNATDSSSEHPEASPTQSAPSFPTTQSGLSRPRVQRYTLSHLMQSIKGTYSWQATDDQLWHPRFNFRIIETEERFSNTVNYIIYNYKKMGLPEWHGKPPFVFVDWEAIRNAVS